MRQHKWREYVTIMTRKEEVGRWKKSVSINT